MGVPSWDNDTFTTQVDQGKLGTSQNREKSSAKRAVASLFGSRYMRCGFQVRAVNEVWL